MQDGEGNSNFQQGKVVSSHVNECEMETVMGVQPKVTSASALAAILEVNVGSSAMRKSKRRSASMDEESLSRAGRLKAERDMETNIPICSI